MPPTRNRWDGDGNCIQEPEVLGKLYPSLVLYEKKLLIDEELYMYFFFFSRSGIDWNKVIIDVMDKVSLYFILFEEVLLD